MIDLDEPIREKMTIEGHWDNSAESARLLLKYPELRKGWTKTDFLELSMSIRAEHKELAEMLSTV